MTVYYDKRILTSFLILPKLIAKWKGSFVKLILGDVLLFGSLYAIVTLVYNYFSESQKRKFYYLINIIANKSLKRSAMIFLGMYVAFVFKRFCDHFFEIPWMFTLASKLATHLPKQDDRTRLMKRTIIRYINASIVMTFRSFHASVARRFTTLADFRKAGILTGPEIKILWNISAQHAVPFIPIAWSASILYQCERENRLKDHYAIGAIIKELTTIHRGCLRLINRDYFCVPLGYTQIVSLGVYFYSFASVFQHGIYLKSDNNNQTLPEPDIFNFTGRNVTFTSGHHQIYFPLISIFEIFMYFGLLRVAATMLNPMGDDDEDFDINDIIDYNHSVGMSIVDEMVFSPPPMTKDPHWDVDLVELPQTEESIKFAAKSYIHSVRNLNG